MKLQLFILFSFGIVCQSDFSTKKCHSEAGLDCMVWYSKNETECTSSNLKNEFPFLYYREDGLYPAVPSLFNVTPIEKLYKNSQNMYILYPGVNITLKVPPDASFKFLKGFQLLRRSGNDDDLTCYIFSFNGTDLTATSKNENIKFEIWAVVVSKVTFYDFEVFSLPLPPEHELSGKSITKSVTVNPNYNLDLVKSADWVTTIGYYYSSVDKLIYIQFAEPPDRYNFTKFILRLVQVDTYDKTVSVEETVISGFEHWFYHVQPGTYKVTVEPQSTYEECYCKNKDDICVTCVRTATRRMVINNVTVTPSPTLPPTIKPIPVEDNTGKVMAAVFGSVLGIIQIAFLSYTLYKKRLQDTDKVLTDHEKVKVANAGVSNVTVLPPINPGHGDVKGEVEMRRPTVLLVSAEDHSDHVKAVGAFASFLDNQCHCKIIYAPWCLHEYLDNKFRWVIGTIEKADFVIIVNSEMSYYQYHAWKDEEPHVWKSSEPSQTSDIFISSINQITRRIISVSNHFKCIIVHFSYTKSKFSLDELCAGSEYLIPKHIHELMCQIHKMDGRTACYNNAGYFADLLDASHDGKYLMQCINKAAAFEQQNPNWFNDYYNCQYDSGISSPTVSCDETTNMKTLDQFQMNINLDEKDVHNHQGRQKTNNLNRGVVPRQRSQEDNSAIGQMPQQDSAIQVSQFPPVLRTSDPYSNSSEEPPDYFEEPSMVGDDDVTSHQLRQEILDLNNRMLASQFYDNYGLVLSETEGEFQSLGGQSV